MSFINFIFNAKDCKILFIIINNGISSPFSIRNRNVDTIVVNDAICTHKKKLLYL